MLSKDEMLIPQVPSVSIVIVNYNHEKFLGDLMTSVLATKYLNFQVIFIDNASTDKSKELMKAFDDHRLTKIFLSENLGLCKARNLGASYKESSYFAFLDPDVKVTPLWLQRLVDTMQSDSDIGIAESNILSQINWGSSSIERVKLYALGASFLVRNKVWHQLGGFDDDYFVGYDDQDLGWRTWLLGYKVIGVSDSDSIVYHHPGLLRKGKGARFFRFHDFKNRLSSFVKNFETATLLKETPRITFAIIAFCYIDFKNGQIDGLKICFWFLKNLRQLLQKRYSIQKARRIGDRNIGPLWDPSVRGSLRRSGRYLW
jgi:GT2 family glycosyltransferase